MNQINTIMSCHCAEKVSLLIDGELPASEVREVESHLLECAECQKLRADFLGLRQQLSSYPAGVDFASQQKALAAILGEQPNQPSARTRWLGLQWNFGRTAVAFASLLLIGLIIGIVTYRSLVLKKANETTALNQSPNSKPSPSPTSEKPKQIDQTAVPPKEQEPKKNKPVEKKRVFPAAIDTKDIFAANRTAPVETETAVKDEAPVRAADAVTMTAMHFERSELLLRAFRNVRLRRSSGEGRSWLRKEKSAAAGLPEHDVAT